MDSSPPIGTAAARRPLRETWAVASGKGGTGKSFLTSSLGIALSRLGKEVILVDADLGCANLHTCLGMASVSETLSDFIAGHVSSLEKIVVPTPYPHLRLVSGAHDILDIANPTHSRKTGLIRALGELDYDYLLLDLGAGTTYNTLDFFLAADKGILMTTPDPTAVENAYRFLKSAFFRSMRSHVKTLAPRQLVERAMDLKHAHGMRSVHDLVRAVGEADADAGARLQAKIDAMRPRLVVNQVRSMDDVRLGFSMSSAVEKFFGVHMDYAGYVEYDDLVWRSARERKPAIAEHPYSGPARCVERLMNNLLNDEALELEWITAGG